MRVSGACNDVDDIAMPGQNTRQRMNHTFESLIGRQQAKCEQNLLSCGCGDDLVNLQRCNGQVGYAMGNQVDLVFGNSKYVLKKSARVLAHHDKPLGSCGDLLEDISLIGIRLTKNRMQSCHNRHSEMLEQLQNMAAGLSPIDPVFVLQTNNINVYRVKIAGGCPIG